MGASLSTIQSTLKQRYEKQDQEQKGYLTVTGVMGIQPQYGVSPSHIGVLFLIDKNRDGRFSLEEILDFATFAYNYARVHRNQDAGFMITGYASLKLWSWLHNHPTQQFVDWTVLVFTQGCVQAHLRQSRQPLARQRALKALHACFDMERTQDVPYSTLKEMVQQVAEEEQLVDRKWQCGPGKGWVPVQVLQVFVQSLAEGMVSIMSSFTSDAGDLLEVLRRAEAAVIEQSRRAGRSSSGGGGGLLTPLNLKKQLYAR